MKKAVICIAKDEAQAEKIVHSLLAENFINERISILMKQKKGSSLSQIKAGDLASIQKMREQALTPENLARFPESPSREVIKGGIAGGLIGGALGVLAGIGALTIPGFGALIVAGPILAALTGSVGIVTGALVGMGLTESEAKQYESKLKEGNVLISIHTETSQEIEIAKRIFANEGAEDISIVVEKQAANY